MITTKQQNKYVPNAKWNKDSAMQFNVSAPDTTNAYNLFINLRNNHEFAYSNLFVIATMQYPNGKTVQDTLEYKMAYPNGELLGTGFTDVKENKLWYKGYQSPFHFEESGEYKIEIQHAMREIGSEHGIADLEGVSDVGFRIELK